MFIGIGILKILAAIQKSTSDQSLVSLEALTAEHAENAAEAVRRTFDYAIAYLSWNRFVLFPTSDFLSELLFLGELCDQKLLIAELAENAAEGAEKRPYGRLGTSSDRQHFGCRHGC